MRNAAFSWLKRRSEGVTAVQYTNLKVSYLLLSKPIMFATLENSYFKAVAAWLMKSLKAATRAISLLPLREITHRS